MRFAWNYIFLFFLQSEKIKLFQTIGEETETVEIKQMYVYNCTYIYIYETKLLFTIDNSIQKFHETPYIRTSVPTRRIAVDALRKQTWILTTRRAFYTSVCLAIDRTCGIDNNKGKTATLPISFPAKKEEGTGCN